MAKRFKLRISKVITTTFQSCRSKDPSTLPQNPVPSFFRFTPLLPHFPADSVDDHRHRSSFRRQNASTKSFACGFSTKQHHPPTHHHLNTARSSSSSTSQQFKWRKEEKWHVIAKIHEKTQTPTRHPVGVERKKRRENKKKKKKISSSRLHVSTSSTESGLFSSEVGNEEEEEEETEILVSSSRSFYSTDSSSSSTRRHAQRKKTYNNYKKPSTKRRPSSSSSVCGEASESPARLSVFKKLIPCTVEGKVKDSFAIVKKSEDPYEDFKRSMIEMILEKQMFEEKDLEQLLQCFLSLNSRHYHGIIVEAFADIWEAMFFCSTDDHHQLQRRRGGGVGFQ